ncbi:gamma-glutamyl-gamma-aminobutyrate hydrolase family protein [Pseudonocardia endophytica]|uniref:Putative glutamine amidotransferase n=1 Tax=Pseudonocardia endophytica TaxID=401976 RepID=A0A4R1HFZ4_PSEEN|nr:gamma-glutamyl-gamma-aminobutyrate hydrolase family protein [Pseudonocardia endophytica]TCK21074.1 putative glutamine amidotransferase [Pseudonocardia endophytica]
MTVPLVGVTGMWSNRVHGLRFDGNAVAVQVLRSIVRAGGEPHALFAESPLDPAERVRRFDAVVVPGGADLSPSTYGAAPHPRTTPADHDGQDEFEAGIIRAAIEQDVPLLAICRGFQLLDVLSGGTLHQHLDESGVHRDGLHDVEVTDGSRLRGIVGADRISVSSYHHQGIDRVGDGLTVTAVAPDGLVEGLEMPGARVVAIQWHPEDRAETVPAEQALFDWVVAEAVRPAASVPASRGTPRR